MIPDLHNSSSTASSNNKVNTDDTPAQFRDLAKILESNSGIDAAAANSKLQLLGWNGVALDYQSLQLALARMVSWLV